MNKEYRVGSMFYDGETHYHIERRIDGGKWKLLFGGQSRDDAYDFLKDPEGIESYYRFLSRSFYLIIGGFIAIGSILYFCF